MTAATETRPFTDTEEAAISCLMTLNSGRRVFYSSPESLSEAERSAIEIYLGEYRSGYMAEAGWHEPTDAGADLIARYEAWLDA